MSTRLISCGAVLALVGCLAGCEGGDIVLAPTNIDNSVDNSQSGGGGTNPCAAYTDPASGGSVQGSFDGSNCTYSSTFVGLGNPLTTDVTIPFISGVHIFTDSLVVGTNVSSGAAPAGGTGPVLTITAGATLAFADSQDYLLINRGSQIIADGSPVAPITLTGFSDAVTGTAGPEDVQLWGGVVINGNGITNNCTDDQRATDQCHVVSEGQPSNYGGDDNTESSGVLRYVVVKHSGFEVAPGDELNGITFNTVGSGTVVENLEIYSTFDDGIEFFGGAVDITNYIALYVRDDSIDFSDGYIGNVTNALVIHQLTDGNRCVEGDNIGSGRADAGEPLDTAPISNPTISNLTCIMSNQPAGTHDPSEGIVLRRGPQAQFVDGIVFGGYAEDPEADNECFEIDDETTRLFAQNGDTTMNQFLIACEDPTKDSLPNGDDIAEWVLGLNPSSSGADYSFNVGNVIIDDPRNANVEILDLFYSPEADDAGVVTVTDDLGNPVTFTPESGQLGAVTRSDDWTANWAFGLSPSNRAQPLWFE
jgi:hypothetical protein